MATALHRNRTGAGPSLVVPMGNGDSDDAYSSNYNNNNRASAEALDSIRMLYRVDTDHRANQSYNHDYNLPSFDQTPSRCCITWRRIRNIVTYPIIVLVSVVSMILVATFCIFPTLIVTSVIICIYYCTMEDPIPLSALLRYMFFSEPDENVNFQNMQTQPAQRRPDVQSKLIIRKVLAIDDLDEDDPGSPRKEYPRKYPSPIHVFTETKRLTLSEPMTIEKEADEERPGDGGHKAENRTSSENEFSTLPPYQRPNGTSVELTRVAVSTVPASSQSGDVSPDHSVVPDDLSHPRSDNTDAMGPSDQASDGAIRTAIRAPVQMIDVGDDGSTTQSDTADTQSAAAASVPTSTAEQGDMEQSSIANAAMQQRDAEAGGGSSSSSSVGGNDDNVVDREMEVGQHGGDTTVSVPVPPATMPTITVRRGSDVTLTGAIALTYQEMQAGESNSSSKRAFRMYDDDTASSGSAVARSTDDNRSATAMDAAAACEQPRDPQAASPAGFNDVVVVTADSRPTQSARNRLDGRAGDGEEDRTGHNNDGDSNDEDEGDNDGVGANSAAKGNENVRNVDVIGMDRKSAAERLENSDDEGNVNGNRGVEGEVQRDENDASLSEAMVPDPTDNSKNRTDAAITDDAAEKEDVNDEAGAVQDSSDWKTDYFGLDDSRDRGMACDICLLCYETDDLVAWSPNKKCCHSYHKDCILDWLIRKPTCPSCRHNYISEKD